MKIEDLFFFFSGGFSFGFVSTVGHDVGEALVVEVAVGINWSQAEHTVHFVFGEFVGLGGEHTSEDILWKGTSTVWVQGLEGVEDDVFWIST